MPNRILKDAICNSEDINALDWAVEVFWYRLIVQCDDYGRMDARPAILRARCYPLALERVTEDAVAEWLRVLVASGMVQLYAVGGKPYLQIVSWERHQRVRAKHAKYPDMTADDSTREHMTTYAPENPNPNPNPKREFESESEKASAAADPHVAAAFQEWRKLGVLIANADQSAEMLERIDALHAAGVDDWWAIACKLAADRNKRSWAYVRNTLDSCLRQGLAPGLPRDGPAPGNGSRPAESNVDAALRLVAERAALRGG